jgi:hypothetical protein
LEQEVRHHGDDVHAFITKLRELAHGDTLLTTFSKENGPLKKGIATPRYSYCFQALGFTTAP